MSSSTAVADLKASLSRRLESIEGYSLVQLRECRGPLSLHAELVDAVRQDTSVIESQLEELALAAEDEETEHARREALSQLDILQARVNSIRKRVREAILTSKRKIDAQNASSQREELFKSANRTFASVKTVNGPTSKEDELMSATANVTDGLRRTRQLMEQELEKSSLSAQMLERSSQTLQLTTNQYTSFSDLLTTSKNIITTLEKADVLDRLLILAALVFFFLVCLLIIKRRIIDRGIRAASLVGRVAGGVGGVGKKGIKAVMHEAKQEAAQLSAASVSSAITAATTLAAAIATQQTTGSGVSASRSAASASVEATTAFLSNEPSSSIGTTTAAAESTSALATAASSASTAPTTLPVVVLEEPEDTVLDNEDAVEEGQGTPSLYAEEMLNHGTETALDMGDEYPLGQEDVSAVSPEAGEMPPEAVAAAGGGTNALHDEL